ncbi:CheY-like superfamily [Penicillium sp. IBT 18751x]|nr:CheY-like superfamily [Penicillium sp. IBT 18751x]
MCKLASDMKGTAGDHHWKVIYHGPEDRKKQSDDKKVLARTLSEPKTMCILSHVKTEISTVTELPRSKLKLPQLAKETTERVFPIRSVLSFDSNPSSALQTPSLDKLETPFSPFNDVFTNGSIDERIGASKKRPNYLVRMRKDRGSFSGVSPSLPIVPTLGHPFPGSEASPFNARSSPEHPTLQEHLHSSILECGRILDTSGKTQGMQSLVEDEASTVIQPFGALFVICGSGDTFAVQIASSNSADILGYSPEELFGLDLIHSLLPESERSFFLSHIRSVLDEEYDVEVSGPEIFDLSLMTATGETKRLWCTMHTSNGCKNYVICEMELEPVNESDTHEDPNSNKGLRDHKDIEVVDQRPAIVKTELLNALPRVLQRIASAQTLQALIQHTMLCLQQLTQFDRLSMFHFDGNRNGVVMADTAEPILGLESYEGIHFEESAFPDDLKKNYLRSPVSFAYRKGNETAKLVYRESATRSSLDLSHCYLPVRAESIKTDRPMQACISIGIYVFGKLWGLILCQSYNADAQPHPLLQKVCWFMSEAVSSNIERLSYTLPFQSQVNSASPIYGNSEGNVKCPSGDLLCLFGADYAAASILEEIKILGKPFDSQEALALLKYMRSKELDTVLWSTDILSDFEDLEYSPGFRHLSGLLFIPLSSDGHDFIIFFRSDTHHENRENLASTQQIDFDKPSGQTEWSAAEFGKASMLSLLYRTFSEIWQEKEAAMQNNQLMRLLLANSAHEFRTPLNAIINYLEIELDGSLNQETRENLSRSHSASKSLVYIINDLLDLTNSENGQNLIKDEVFSLSDTLCEATDIFWEEARQKHVDLQVVQHAALPPVLGDQRRVRQVITNLISNAVRHTTSGAVTIESCVPSEAWKSDHITVEVAFHDTGSGMSPESVETLFCELEQVSNSGYLRNPHYEKKSDGSTMKTGSVLGLGLALVARIVRNMNGQLSLKSEEGKGSCFKIRLNFPLSEKEKQSISEDSKGDPSNDGNSVQQPDGVGKDQVSCKPNISKNDPRRTPKEGAQGEGEGVICKCGDETFTSPSNFCNLDISLKPSEARNLCRSKDEAEPPSKPEHQISTDQKQRKSSESAEMPQISKLRILVAEDDPINSTIVKKRLEKLDYMVHMTSNGKQCASLYIEWPHSFDAILMDLQMPIVDGITATKMIRDHEAQFFENCRISIFAVSASLKESDRKAYIEAGFDGWIMKPIDFKRVNELLQGLGDKDNRESCLYQASTWEQGGWFQADEEEASS